MVSAVIINQSTVTPQSLLTETGTRQLFTVIMQFTETGTPLNIVSKLPGQVANN